MVHLDLFSGIGGFSKGLQDGGIPITKTYYSEIDKHAIAVYKHNFPDAEYAGPVQSIWGGLLERPRIITFGSPCQDFSVAGKSAGLDGTKSSLIREAIRLISETRPDVFIWENVAGAFSTNGGADFWAIITAFTNIGGYRLEWQLLNTAWVLPQNRERIYLIGHLDGASRPGVFPFRESDFENNEFRRQTVNCIDANYWKGIDNHGQRTVVQIVAGKQPQQQDRVYDINGLSPALCAGSEGRGPAIISRGRGFNEGGISEVCGTITASRFEQNHHVLQDDLRIRRLTEIECERLQGFQDDWTRYGNYNGVVREISKTERYKMCGNAVTVDIVELIGKRLQSLFIP